MEATTKPEVRLIAFYLPQFHPIPENDLWWGEGFTEWTNVTRAKPLFKGHYQPRLPANLGFYDLRIPEVRMAQAKMAANYGIEGFCYWHYWFGNGKKILERPIAEVLRSGSPDYPFCLAWANGSWSGIWHGNPKNILIEQTYPGKADYIAFFNDLLTAFRDPRYITVESKPLFCINEPSLIPDLRAFTDLFREQALKNGLKGLYIVVNTGDMHWDPLAYGCDAVNLTLLGNLYRGLPDGQDFFYRKFKNQLIKRPSLTDAYRRIWKRPVQTYHYEDVIPYLIPQKQLAYDSFPCVYPNWDNSARSGLRSMILYGSTPELFARHLKQAMAFVRDRDAQKKIIFIKSWNEWAEGNHLEPDHLFGMQYLEVVKHAVSGT
jgi:hypothetical protein